MPLIRLVILGMVPNLLMRALGMLHGSQRVFLRYTTRGCYEAQSKFLLKDETMAKEEVDWISSSQQSIACKYYCPYAMTLIDVLSDKTHALLWQVKGISCNFPLYIPTLSQFKYLNLYVY